MEHQPPSTAGTTTTAVVSIDLPLVSGEDETQLLGGELRYLSSDPYAVTLWVHAPGGSVAWTFARELLAEGRYQPIGDGDVQVWPCLSMSAEAVTVIELHAPTGEAMLQASSRKLDQFLQRSYAAVPVGEENAHLQLDALVDRLLG